MADSSQNVLRRRPTATGKGSSDAYSDEATPRSPFSDDEGYVVVSGHPYAEDNTPYRPSLGGYSDHISDADHGRLSYDPLLPTPSNQFARYDQPNTEAEHRLLTLNELNPVERANLVRQSRKLNKILGTTPHIAEMTQPSSPRNAPNRLQRRGTLAGSDIRLDRSASMAALSSPPLEATAGSQWGKTASSLVATSSPSTANANIPLLKLNVAPSSGDVEDTKRARRLSDSSVTSSLISVTLPRRSGSSRLTRRQLSGDNVDDSQATPSHNAPNTLRPDAGIYLPPSPTSPPYVSDSLRRQQTRARMAKLQQIMGESVPSELVMATNPNNTRRRRLSMESPTTPTAATTKALKHKRSKSLWRKEVNDNFEFDSAPENSFPYPGGKGHSKSKSREMPPIEDLLRKQLQTPMNEKQKALNVKRALKMAAVFGVPPPSTLYQDPSFPVSSGSFDPSASRQSLASLAYMLDHDRDSLYDLLSSIVDSDSESDEEPVKWPYEHKPRTDSLPEARPNTPSSTSMGDAKYSVAGRHPDMVPPTPPFRDHANSKPISSKPPPLPIYSISVSTIIGEDDRPKQPSSSLKKKPSSATVDQQFTSRRRRAKKLSRFFGVGYNELFNTLIYEDALSDNRSGPKSEAPLPPLPTEALGAEVASAGGSEHRRMAAAPSAYRGTGRGGTVLVQTENGKKATVLRTSANVAADVDAAEVGEMMARLRALRA